MVFPDDREISGDCIGFCIATLIQFSIFEICNYLGMYVY